jgi:hypothetical protein
LLPLVPSVQSLRIPFGFLLIVRTGRIVTAPTSRRVPPDTRVFQHIARFYNGLEIPTVIVTAAVYRGLGSELRLAANPSP